MNADIEASSSRFWMRVNCGGEAVPGLGQCWIWQGGGGSNGYGLWRPKRGVTYYAHRFAYMNKVGEIPPGLVIDHLCRVRRCVNPSHLEAVTSRVNTLRGVAPSAQHAAQTHCINGHPLVAENLYATKGRVCKVCGQERDRKRSPEIRNARRRDAYATAKVQKMQRSGGNGGGQQQSSQRGGNFDDPWASQRPGRGSGGRQNDDSEPPF